MPSCNLLSYVFIIYKIPINNDRNNFIQDVINEIGGFAAILPIIEQLEFMHLISDCNNDQDEGYHFEETDGMNSPNPEDERFISVPDQITGTLVALYHRTERFIFIISWMFFIRSQKL